MDVREALAEARALYDAGEYSQSTQMLAETLAEHPRSSDVLFWLARAAVKQNDWKAVRDHAAGYLAVAPPRPEVVTALAKAHNKLKDVSAAADAWALLAELQPDSIEAWRQASRAQARSGNDHAAIASATALAALARAEPAAISAALDTLFDREQLADAAMLCAHLARNFPAYLQAHLLGSNDEDLRMHLLVSAALVAAGAELPDERPTVEALAEALLVRAVREERRGGWHQACLDFRAVLLAMPGDLLATRSLARLLASAAARVRSHIRSGNTDEALAAQRLLHRLDPADPVNRAAYGTMLVRAQQWEPALDIWRAVLASSPSDEEALLNHARATEALGRPVRAMAAWETALAHHPEQADALRRHARLSHLLLARGRAAVAEGRAREAARYFLAIPAQAKEHEEATRRLHQVGRHLLREMREAYKRRDYAAVLSAGLAGRDFVGDDSDFHRLLAKGAMRMKQRDAADRAWATVAAISTEAPVHLEIARYHLAALDLDAAYEAARRAQAIDPSEAGEAVLSAIDLARSGSPTAGLAYAQA